MDGVQIRWEWDPKSYRRGRSLLERSANRRSAVIMFLVMTVVSVAVVFSAASGVIRRGTGATILTAFLGGLGAVAVLVVIYRISERRRSSMKTASSSWLRAAVAVASSL